MSHTRSVFTTLLRHDKPIPDMVGFVISLLSIAIPLLYAFALTPALADDGLACEEAQSVFEKVAERYESMKSGGKDLNLSLALVSMSAAGTRSAAIDEKWEPEIIETLLALQGAVATDGKGGFKPNAEDSPNYVLGLAWKFADQVGAKCPNTEFVKLPARP